MSETGQSNPEITNEYAEWHIPSELEFLDSTEEAFGNWLRWHLADRFKDQEEYELFALDAKYGFREALANAISYGNLEWKPEPGQKELGTNEREKLIKEKAKRHPDLAKRRVGIKVSIENNQLVVRIQDYDKKFTLDQAPDPLAPENLMKQVGRGVFLMRSMLYDDVSVEPNHSGKEVVLKKDIPV